MFLVRTDPSSGISQPLHMRVMRLASFRRTQHLKTHPPAKVVAVLYQLGQLCDSVVHIKPLCKRHESDESRIGCFFSRRRRDLHGLRGENSPVLPAEFQR
jgi:hypothetical protein